MSANRKISLSPLSVNEAARFLNISPSTLRELSNRQYIECTRDERGHRVFDPAVITGEKARRAQKRAHQEKSK